MRGRFLIALFLVMYAQGVVGQEPPGPPPADDPPAPPGVPANQTSEPEPADNASASESEPSVQPSANATSNATESGATTSAAASENASESIQDQADVALVPQVLADGDGNENVAPVNDCAASLLADETGTIGREGLSADSASGADGLDRARMESNEYSIPAVGAFDAGWATLGLIGTLLGLLVGSRFGRTRRPETAVPAAPAPTSAAPAAFQKATDLDALVKRVDEQPLDGEAAFQLGLHLIREGEDSQGIRYLDRAFRLRADLLIRLLEDPQLSVDRRQPCLVPLLAQIRRDIEWRTTRGYA